uniref:Alpha-conotoxin Lt1.46 n=1 Tax=Conus litteratus TaxID=89445 RepID=D9IWN8_CONLT|nr:alpha-conotoxin Lt1.46 precursor [Conus litteratus]
MGMRMMFTVFLLVVLATTVVSLTLDRASGGRRSGADNMIALLIIRKCCSNPACNRYNKLC